MSVPRENMLIVVSRSRNAEFQVGIKWVYYSQGILLMRIRR